MVLLFFTLVDIHTALRLRNNRIIIVLFRYFRPERRACRSFRIYRVGKKIRAVFHNDLMLVGLQIFIFGLRIGELCVCAVIICITCYSAGFIISDRLIRTFDHYAVCIILILGKEHARLIRYFYKIAAVISFIHNHAAGGIS